MAIQQQIVKPRMVYIQKETTNQSFIDMYNYLKAKGIQNNDFFLSLLDPDLAGVDPRDPNLSPIMKGKILNECMHNYWYYLREVLRIPDQGGTVETGKRFQLNRASLAMNFLFMMNFNMFVEQPRQTGKTTTALGRYLWVYNFGTTNSEIMFMHKDHTGSKGNLKNLKSYRDALPSYLQMSSAVGADGKKLKVPNTIVTIENPYNRNKIVTVASARSKDAANNLGRGSTQPIQYYDEFAFIPYNQVVYEAAVPAFSTASRNAARNGAPYGILLTTTPGDLLTDAGAYAFQVRNNATPWNEHYYDLTYQQLLDLSKSNDKSIFFHIRYTYQQLGLGNDYFTEQVRNLGQNWASVRREIMLEWAEIAPDCAFSQEDLDKIKTYLKDPIRTIFFGRFQQYQFNIYEDLDFNYPPIIGVDVSGATYHDSSAITVIDSKTTKVCATLNCNFMPQDDLADVIYELVSKYMPNAIINVERNGGFGNGVVQRLCKTSVKKNLYWEIKDKVVEESFNGVRMERRPRKVRVYGLDSTKEVRARLIEILYSRVRYHKDKFIAPILHDEMQHMQVKKSGKVEHSDQTHDDQVFSYLMALYVWYDGKNIAEWGIQKNTLKTDEDLDFEEGLIEEQDENTEKLNLNTELNDEDEQLAQDLEWVEAASKAMDSKQFREKTFFDDHNQKEKDLLSNSFAREAYERTTGLDMEDYKNNASANYVDLPMNMFGAIDPNNDPDEDEIYSPIQGNLVNWWDKV